jgi:ubiquinone/menaquinone biosynthesis C-methylase UbiE
MNSNQNAVASDISDIFLQEAKKEGLISDCKVLNVENIELADNSFDYVFCKEAFHHFPKAYIGLYEMIRCSKNAAIIIEPIDIITKMPVLLTIKNILDRFNPILINKIWKNRFSFEVVGNYIFKISEREIEKIAMGMGLRCIAFKRLNIILDFKIDSSIISETPKNEKYWKKIQRKYRLLDLLCYLHIIPYNHLCCVVFKTQPDTELVNSLKASGYTIIELPKNPYLNSIE